MNAIFFIRLRHKTKQELHMKKIAFALLIVTNQTYATSFTSRFGPNSPVYNQPLYFSTQHMIARPKKIIQKKYRDAIKRKISQSSRKKAHSRLNPLNY